MLSLLPLCLLALTACIAAGTRTGQGGLRFDLRDALLVGAVAVGAWAAIGAEGLSLFSAFAAGPVAVWWGLAVAVAGVVAWRCPPDPNVLVVRPGRDGPMRVAIGIGIAVVLATGAVAWLTPPTTWDALSYHLPRQLYWIENRSVAHFPAVDLRQLEMPPFAEFLGAQLMLLSGNDHQANLIQWFSFVLGALAASAVARDLGAGVRGQSLAGLLTLLNPAAATQAENAKNDLVVALWALVLMWAATRVWVAGRCRVRDAVLVGFTLGLLLLTKGTGYVLAAPLCVVVAGAALRAHGPRAIPLGVAMVVIAAGLNAGHWSRNAAVFGSPLALPAARGGHDLANTLHTPAALASNIIRNVSLHTDTPLSGVNAWEQEKIEGLHRAMGLDASDLRVTAPRNLPFAVNTTWNRDGSAGSPLHLALVLGLGGALLWGVRRIGARAAWPIWLAPLGAMLLFCVLLKWQPWHARLHIPYAAIMAPAVGAWINARTGWILAIAAAGLVETVPSVLFNEAKPLVGAGSIVGLSRQEILFSTQPGALEGARAALQDMKQLGPSTIAFDLPGYSCEYAAMRLALDTLKPRPRFFALYPNYARDSRPRTDCPDAVLTWNRGPAVPLHDPATQTVLLHASSGGCYHIYVPASRLADVRLTLPTPEFYGWSAEDGLRRAEGPYPQWELPVVRWAYTPTTTLRFESDGAPMTLVMEARRNDRTDQEMTVRLNGRVVRQFAFGDIWQFLPLRLPLATRAGENVITLEYANTNAPGPARSALFRRLQILPDAWLASAPDGSPHP